MQTTHSRLTRFGAVALVAATTLLPAAAAQAKDGDIIKRGGCSGAADWKLKASPENGRIEVEGEVDSNKNGQKWRWGVRPKGSTVGKGEKTRGGASGALAVGRGVVHVEGGGRGVV